MDTQSVDTFKQFIEFVKNIDHYNDIVDQLKTATEDHQAAFNLLTDGKTLQAFSDKLDAVEARLALERQEFDKACKAQNEVLAQRVKDLNDREAVLNEQANTQAGVNQTQIQMAQFNLAKASDLDKKESDLNVQIAKNNQVAEDLAKRVALVLQAAA